MKLRIGSAALALGLLAAFGMARAAAPVPAPVFAAPHFTDPDRLKRIQTLFPEIDGIYAEAAKARNFPGLVWGIVLDGELIHTGALGLANVERKLPATADSRFRIASMTKSFTALAVVKLRDAGKLSLEDAAEKYLPEMKTLRLPTSDAPAITIRHLLTMTPGFPEDNPWGDRQLAVTPAALEAFVRGGIAFSNPPGLTFEYSNLSFALLGQIVSRVAGEPYQTYITREILRPLGLNDTKWEFTDVPADKLALGYRWTGTAWELEPMLHDGTYGAMGGLLTTIPDLARYVGFHLAAWPARDGPDRGPVRRSSLREMQKPAEFTGLNAEAVTTSAYGYGLSWSTDRKGVVQVGHSGGLPGFGSHYRFLPDHGLGVMAFSNLTYGGPSRANARVIALLLEKANLPRRIQPVSALLARRQAEVARLIVSWEPALADALAAENFFLDRTRDAWRERARETLAKAGAIRSTGALVAENQLRGTFPLVGERGRVDVFFTLTPEVEAKLQELQLTFVPNP